tara:strand:+ start:155 stop:592 length:438 start_codon:yes stop_codon:yes gene_type:complete
VPSTPIDFLRLPLLLRQDEISKLIWELCSQAVDVSQDIYGPSLTDGIYYPDPNRALQAAFEGQEVALVIRAHFWTDVVSGRIFRLLPDIEVPFNMDYYTFFLQRRGEEDAIQKSCNCLGVIGHATVKKCLSVPHASVGPDEIVKN